MRPKPQSGQPFASIFYTDESGGKLLTATSYGLQGKPDYIFKTWFLGRLIPFEIKSGMNKEDEPHLGDMMQLAAYFLIVEEVYGKKPPYGKLVYKNKTFKIRNTAKIRRQVKMTLREMRQMLEGDLHSEADPSFMKCKNCVCQKTVCSWYDE